jgi:hypothetical protein
MGTGVVELEMLIRMDNQKLEFDLFLVLTPIFNSPYQTVGEDDGQYS